MAITDRLYRTCTYIAGDWTGDSSAIEELQKWNESDHWGLSFIDVHSLTQSRDSSQNCSIKSSLRTRMNYCKTFVLIVGEQTNTVTSGACFWCDSYISPTATKCAFCKKGYSIDNRSYIKTECDMAASDYDANKLKIIVLYNAEKVDRNKCPEAVRWKGTHLKMFYKGSDGKYYWNYSAIKQAFEE